MSSVADPDPGFDAFLTPESGMVKKVGFGIRDEHPDPQHFFFFKYFEKCQLSTHTNFINFYLS